MATSSSSRTPRAGRRSRASRLQRFEMGANSSNNNNGGGRPRALSAATLLAASGAAVLMLSSSNQFGKSTGGNLRYARKLAATPARTLATIDDVSPAVVDLVHRLAEPFLADHDALYAFDEADPRPVVNTFWAIEEGRPLRETDAETLAIWKKTWSDAGWNPRILSIKDAEAHPNFAEIDAKLQQVPLGGNVFYDRSCYLRHVAMAANGGGWMTDYDTVPLHMDPAVYGAGLPNDGQFTSYEGNVPALIVGNSDEWERVANAMIQEGLAAKERGEDLFSDMHALVQLAEKKEVIINDSLSVRQPRDFSEIMVKDLDVGFMKDMMRQHALVHKSCEETRDVLALHFSHKSTDALNFLESRPLLIAEYLDRWSKLCGKDHYHTDDTMAISRENSFVYVHVPQTGGPIVGRSSIFADAWSHHRIGSHYDIESMMKDADERGMSDFTKAAHIRHPCDRFVDAFEFMTSDSSKANGGDRAWAASIIGDKSIDEFVVQVEKNPEQVLQEVHFSPMWKWLFHPDGTYGLDGTMCQETWAESLDKLANDFSIPVPDDLMANEEMTNQQSKCQDLRPETVAAIERIYHMDYCIFGYEDLPQKSCPQQDLSKDDLTQRYKTCTAQENVPASKLLPAKSPIVDASLAKENRHLGDAAEAQRQVYFDLTPTKSMSLK